MKRNTQANSFRNTAFVLLMVFVSAGVFAQSAQSSRLPNAKTAIANLKMGIASENEGVRRSSIYYAGQYKVAEVKDQLVGQLRKENNPGIKILIGLSLYAIGDADCIRALKNMAAAETNERVSRMFAEIYNQFTGERELTLVSGSN